MSIDNYKYKGIQKFNVIFTKQFIFFIIPTFIIFISLQLGYAQPVEDEIIANVLETVDNVTTKALLEIKEPVSNASKSIAISKENATELANNDGSENTIDGTRKHIEESVMDPDRTKQSTTLKNPLNVQSEFKEYISEPLGVKLQIPVEWDIFQENNSTKDCFIIHRCVVFFGSYSFDNITPDYAVAIQKYGLTSMDIKDLARSTYFYHEETMKGFTFINDSNTTIQNNPAWQMEYAGTSINNDKMKYMKIFTKVNNTDYEILYESDESGYSKYLPEALNVINTIEFIPSKPPEEKRPSFLD